AETEGWTTARLLVLLAQAGPAEKVVDGRGQRDRLLGLVDGVELWLNPDSEAFATVPVGDHRENLAIGDRAFRRWLLGRCIAGGEVPPGGQAIDDFLRIIEARGVLSGIRHRTWRRVGEHGGRIYIDLGNDAWDAVEVDADGWRLVSGAPCKFVR